MSYLYRPTPVMNPWGAPPPDVVKSGLRGGTMRGFQQNVNWQDFFNAARRVSFAEPWITRSGAMGRYGMGDDTTDFTDLPLAPVDSSNINLDLTPALPVDLYPMTAPIAPPVAPYNPGPISAAPSITSGGGVVSPGSNMVPSTSPSSSSGISALLNSISSLTTSVTRAINPTAAPPIAAINTTGLASSQQSLVAQAQQLQAQAAAIAASNPTLAAQYQAQANQLLAQAGTAGSGFFAWFTESTLIAGLPNWGALGIGVAAIAALAGAVKVARR